MDVDLVVLPCDIPASVLSQQLGTTLVRATDILSKRDKLSDSEWSVLETFLIEKMRNVTNAIYSLLGPEGVTLEQGIAVREPPCCLISWGAPTHMISKLDSLARNMWKQQIIL